MSRCFPFPPPGYDKKVRTNDVDLLKKEKHKEKKHKKEKKDKEKREGKEKKEKDRTDGKHKEKKDKKDKQRDKSKDRDKDRDKDKAGTSGEKKLGVQYEAQNENPVNKGNGKEKIFISSDGKKLSAQFTGHNGFVQNGHIVEETSNHKLVQELDRRIRAEGVGPQMAEKFTAKVQRDDSGEKVKQNGRTDQSEDSKLVQELGKRIKNEVPAAGASHTVEKHSGLDKKKNEVVRSVALDISNSSDAKERNREKRGDARNIDAQGSLCEPKYRGNSVVQKPSGLAQSGDARNIEAQGSLFEPRYGGNSVVPKLSGLAQSKAEGMPISEDKKNEKLGSQERSKDKENGNKQGDKRKDKDGEKDRKSQEKDRSKEKKKKKEEKAKEKAEQKSVMQDKNEKNKGDHLGKSLDHHSDSKNIVGGNERHLKRKEPEINGFLHVTEARAHKLHRPVLSHALIENGKVSEACHYPTKSIHDSPGEVVNTLREVNGSAEAPLISTFEAKQPSTTVQAEQIAVSPSRSPHPDTVYLSQILTVPKVDEWSEFDDQKWLYSDDKEWSKKPKVEPCLDADTAQVWSEALQIKSPELCILPYVIPY